MENYVITVSRMFGSRGHEIAARLGELLQIPVYDRSSVEALVPDPGSLQNAGTEGEHSGRAEETGAAPQSFMARLFRRDTRDHAAEEAQAMFNAQAEVIRGLAEEGSCIILGRCGDQIFHGKKRCLNVFLFAPDEVRIRNCMEMLHTDETYARTLIASEDRTRREYRKRFSADFPDEVTGRQLLLDSSVFGVEESARILASAARYLFYDDCYYSRPV